MQVGTRVCHKAGSIPDLRQGILKMGLREKILQIWS